MLVNETLSEGLKRGLTVTIPASELDARLTDRLTQLKTQVRLKGFRPGKVPENHLRRVYGKAAMAEIVQGLVGETTQQAISDRGERVAMQPKVALPEDEAEAEEVLEGRADLTFTLEYEVLPTYELGDFKGLKIERPVAEVSDEEVESRLRQIAESARTYNPVERPAATGDRVSFEYSASTDGKVFETSSTQVVLGSGSFIPGFEDALTGVQKGDKKNVDLTFPTDYPAAELKGKPATFEVTVTEVAEPGEIVLDDEFATRVGIESIDKLRETVRKQIESEHGRATRQKVKRQLLDQLDAMHSFPLPENLVEQEFENIWRQVTHDVEHHGRSFEDEGTTEEAAKADYRRIAERRVRLGLVLSKIGEDAAITIADDEIQAALFEQARNYPGQERQVLDYYRNNPDALQGLRAPIFEEKVVDHVISFADVTDKSVSKEELLAEDEDDEAGHHHHDHGHEHHDHGGHDHDH
jgi:trigger factor